MAPKARPAYWSLMAWNIELSRARNLASLQNPSISAGKFAFWKDVVKGQESDHPIAASLRSIIKANDLPLPTLLEIIEEKVLRLAILFDFSLCVGARLWPKGDTDQGRAGKSILPDRRNDI